MGIALSIKLAQKPYIRGSLGPKASKYESFEGKGKALCPKTVLCRFWAMLSPRTGLG